MSKITSLKPNQIFVFGSNLRGAHGAGAAKDALAFGARYNIGIGLCGQTYAIPTKDMNIQTLLLEEIAVFVTTFIHDAQMNPELEYLVTEIGCGLAGYSPEDIAPMFRHHSSNVILPQSFKIVLNEGL